MTDEAQVIPLLLNACPSFGKAWEAHRQYWGDDEAGPYTDVSEFAHHLIGLLEEGNTDCFPIVFEVIERLVQDDNGAVRDLVIVGLLEDLQNIALNRAIDLDVFLQWLKPESRDAWAEIIVMWDGKSNLADVVREENRVSQISDLEKDT